MLLKLVSLVLLSIPLAIGDQNVTVDDTDPSIIYQGTWTGGNTDTGSFGGSHHASNTPGSTATFQFTG